MRCVINPQMELGELSIDNIHLDPRSRDDIPKLLQGLKYIYRTPDVRNEVFDILAEVLPKNTDGQKVQAGLGRPGMPQWRILVMGVVRLGINADYDRLLELVNQHRTLRQMLGHADWRDETEYSLQSLKDNLRLFTPEILDRINQVVVKAGHVLVKKSPEDALKGRCDSFVVETDVHYPTDLNLLLDAVRKAVEIASQLAHKHALPGWRQHVHLQRNFKHTYRKVQTLRRLRSKDEEKKANRALEIKAACEAYLNLAQSLIERAQNTGASALTAKTLNPVTQAKIIELNQFIAQASLLSNQVRRRLILGETIPHDEKIFSIFQPHTEWINKGKAGVPVELGLKVCILEDHHQFILHHQVMQKQADSAVAIEMVEQAQVRFSELRMVSFDQGFHSPENQKVLAERLECAALPKKGRRTAAEQQQQASESFSTMRRAHSSVESAINGLEHFGLDRCPDDGIDGFKRYVALAVLARNLFRLGVIVRQQTSGKFEQNPPHKRRAA